MLGASCYSTQDAIIGFKGEAVEITFLRELLRITFLSINSYSNPSDDLAVVTSHLLIYSFNRQ